MVRMASSSSMTQQFLLKVQIMWKHIRRLMVCFIEMGGILQWADEHNCLFGIEKFQLIDFTRGKSVTKGMSRIGQPIIVRDHKIKPQQSAKFLGIIVNQALNWKEQIAAAVAKGETWISQFGHLAKATKGINATFVRQLYQAIALPRMLYGADIYLTPTRRHQTTAPNAEPTYNKTVCGRNEAVQSQEVKGLLLSLGEQQQLHACTSDAHMLMRGRKTVYHYVQHLYIP